VLEADFALFNVDQLVTMAPGSHPATQGQLGTITRGALAARDGKIIWVGHMNDLESEVRLQADATVVNTHGRAVLPGFVDPHTHPVFAGNRVDDFYARAAGARYASQLKSGGIMTSIEATRAASEDSLLDAAYGRAETFLQYGTTTIEAKTGYGQTRDSELRSLRALNRLQRLSRLKVVPTYLPAHVVPADFDGGAAAYAEDVASQWLPDAVDRAAFVDVWLDQGAFSVEEGERVFHRAAELGLGVKAHANELGLHGGVQAAVRAGAISVDHAVYLSDEDVDALRRGSTVAVLLPGTSFFLDSQYAPARRLIDAGVRVALGTDFNPGTSFTQNMQFILTLAVLKLGMTAEEAIEAATRGGAAAIGMEDVAGSLEVGKYCDFSVFCVSDYRLIPYMYAMNLVETVVANGQIAVRDGRIISGAPLVRA
jgi:imidazolonepropionase